AEFVVATLAVLYAGAAYVPLDGEYPAERIAFMLQDAAPAVVVSSDRLAARLPRGPWHTLMGDEAAAGDPPPPASVRGDAAATSEPEKNGPRDSHPRTFPSRDTGHVSAT